MASDLFLIYYIVSHTPGPYVAVISTNVVQILIFVLGLNWVLHKVEYNCLITCFPCPIQFYISISLVPSFTIMTPRYLHESTPSSTPRSNDISLHVFLTLIYSVLLVLYITHIKVISKFQFCHLWQTHNIWTQRTTQIYKYYVLWASAKN